MNHEDDLALAIMTEAACTLLATLASEGIDIPETRALEAIVLTQYARSAPEE